MGVSICPSHRTLHINLGKTMFSFLLLTFLLLGSISTKPNHSLGDTEEISSLDTGDGDGGSDGSGKDVIHSRVQGMPPAMSPVLSLMQHSVSGTPPMMDALPTEMCGTPPTMCRKKRSVSGSVRIQPEGSVRIQPAPPGSVRIQPLMKRSVSGSLRIQPEGSVRIQPPMNVLPPRPGRMQRSVNSTDYPGEAELI